MQTTAREVLDDVHKKLNDFKVELDARMATVSNNRPVATTNGHASARTTNSANNANSTESAPTSARLQTTGNTPASHQVQYCGPYKLEKTLGKGQTGK
jgi:hypothetical protein